MRSVLFSRPRLIGLVTVLAAAFALPLIAQAEGREALSQKEFKKRRSALRTAAGRYITHRARFPSRCPACKGAGKRRVKKHRGYKIYDCSQCVGKGAWIAPKDYQAVYYDMRTPAYQTMPDIKKTLEAQYKLARTGQPWPLIIKRYRLGEWEMIDATHGIVSFRYNADRVPTPTRWIYALDLKGRKSRWFLYDARSDGEWPEGPAGATPGGAPLPRTGTESLAQAQAQTLRGVVAQARITFRVTESSESGSALELTLRPGTDGAGRVPADRVRIDAVRLARAALSGKAPWDRVQAIWHDLWRDAYGRNVLRPRWTSGISRAKHDQSAWESMSLLEQAKTVSLVELTYPGWEPVEPGETAPAKPEPVRPTPVEPTPTEPNPQEPVPEEPTREPPVQPTPVAPRPPTPAPSTAPDTLELPALTPKAERVAKKGLAEIRELLEAATAAFNEGQKARTDGSHDLWQEKLSQAGTHLGEIDDVWYEDIVPGMPGRDEAEKDAVANEHYGEIWDDVSKLRSIVRKVSAIR